jgi:hypothetical protein
MVSSPASLSIPSPGFCYPQEVMIELQGAAALQLVNLVLMTGNNQWRQTKGSELTLTLACVSSRLDREASIIVTILIGIAYILQRRWVTDQ